jgi:arginase
VSDRRLVRVPRAWGAGGEAMCEAAAMPLPVADAAIIAEASLAGQTSAIAAALPERPLVLGGCCCAHIGAAAGCAARHGRIGIVWLDAHGDLNTPQSSPSGNEWGLPFRIILDQGLAAIGDCILIGARSLDPPEQAFIAETGLADSIDDLERVLEGVAAVYVAFDCDVLDPGQIACFMPEPGGLSLDETVAILEHVAGRVPIVGMGLTGLIADPANVPRLVRLCDAAGLSG